MVELPPTPRPMFQSVVPGCHPAVNVVYKCFVPSEKPTIDSPFMSIHMSRSCRPRPSMEISPMGMPSI